MENKTKKRQMVRQTSLMAYEQHINAVSQRDKIFCLIRNTVGGITRQEIAQITNIPINAVCGRVKELLDNRIIKENGVRKNKTGRHAYVLEVM